MNLSTSNSDQTKAAERSKAIRFLLRYALPFVLIMSVVAFAWDYLLREKVIFQTETHGATKLNRAFQPHIGEVPIFGSSRALGSYVPDSIFPSSYNYGVNGIGYLVMDVFLKREIESKNTEPIVLSYDYEMFIGSGGDPSSYIPLTENIEIRDLLRDLKMYEPYYRLPGIRFYGGFDGYFREYLNQKLQLTKWVTKGAAIEKNRMPPDFLAKQIEMRMANPLKWEPDSVLLNLFMERLELSKHRHIYLVIPPYHKSYYESFLPGELTKARTFFRSLERFPHVDVLEIPGNEWPDSMFTNTSHINDVGAIRFSREFREWIALPDSLRSN